MVRVRGAGSLHARTKNEDKGEGKGKWIDYILYICCDFLGSEWFFFFLGCNLQREIMMLGAAVTAGIVHRCHRHVSFTAGPYVPCTCTQYLMNALLLVVLYTGHWGTFFVLQYCMFSHFQFRRRWADGKWELVTKETPTECRASSVRFDCSTLVYLPFPNNVFDVTKRTSTRKSEASNIQHSEPISPPNPLFFRLHFFFYFLFFILNYWNKLNTYIFFPIRMIRLSFLLYWNHTRLFLL